MTLAQFIARRRRALGLRQLDVAEMIGVSRQAVSHWEAGHNRPLANQLPALALALKVSDAELLALIEDPITRRPASRSAVATIPHSQSIEDIGTASIAGIELDGVRWQLVDGEGGPRPMFCVEDVRQWLATATEVSRLVEGVPLRQRALLTVQTNSGARPSWHVSIGGLHTIAARSRSDEAKVVALLDWAADVLERVALGRPVAQSTMPAHLVDDPIIRIRVDQIEHARALREHEERLARIEAERAQVKAEVDQLASTIDDKVADAARAIASNPKQRTEAWPVEVAQLFKWYSDAGNPHSEAVLAAARHARFEELGFLVERDFLTPGARPKLVPRVAFTNAGVRAFANEVAPLFRYGDTHRIKTATRTLTVRVGHEFAGQGDEAEQVGAEG